MILRSMNKIRIIRIRFSDTINKTRKRKQHTVAE